MGLGDVCAMEEEVMTMECDNCGEQMEQTSEGLWECSECGAEVVIAISPAMCL